MTKVKVAVAGSAIKWSALCPYSMEPHEILTTRILFRLRDSMNLINSAAEVNALAGRVSSTEGVYFVTAFSGLLAPYWDPGAGGLLIGTVRNYRIREH